jgi:hypothetical protein
VRKPHKTKLKKRRALKGKPSTKSKQLTISVAEWAHALVEASKATKRRQNADLN